MPATSLQTKNGAPQPRRALTAPEIIGKLAQLDGWRLRGDGSDLAIEKNFSFTNYFETMAFANAVAFIAHRQDHHPELLLRYASCQVRLNTHDVQGLSLSDFDCAAQIEALRA